MVTLKKWTVNELLAMQKAGLLDPEKKNELIDGEVYEMSIGEDHADLVDRLNEALVSTFAGRARVRVQNPVRLDPTDLPQLVQLYKRINPLYIQSQMRFSVRATL